MSEVSLKEGSVPIEACPECGGDCAPECGLHPAGCIYGGFSKGYWLVADDCDRSHGEEAARP